MSAVALRKVRAELACKPLRFLTAGSVDDGKSTLIGRLLFDSRAILTDQLDGLRDRAAGGALDLALLTDGLEAEREQGITIDVAFRYFATPSRKFIIADAPGHEQYTRNMVTAAAGSDAAVVLVDATKLSLDSDSSELLPQTRRHALLARMLGVPHIVFAVNKLDAVAAPRRVFGLVRDAILRFADDAGIEAAGIVAISALRGDNVASSSSLAGYDGPTLLSLLEGLSDAAADEGSLLLPVQFVSDSAGHDATGNRDRVLWGRIARGGLRVGDEVVIFPSGERARVAALHAAGEAASQVLTGCSAGVVLDRQIDVSRGDWLAAPGSLQPADRFEATLAWLDVEPAVVGRKYWLRHGNRWLQGRIAEIRSRLDIRTLAPQAAEELSVNEIGSVVVETQQALPVEDFSAQPVAGALLVVDAATNRTSGVFLVQRPA
jgi:sulfate adenylyltransferase subunit 1